MKSHKIADSMMGAMLGLGAPLGSILLKGVLLGEMSLGWIAQEIGNHLFFYSYMALATPAVFAAFGWWLGLLRDRLLFQQESLKGLNVLLEQQATVDDITGLYNHRHILDEIEKEVERSRRHGRPISGMMIDVDDFKKVNDRYGHLVGDDVLREVAVILKNCVRKIDTVGRYGGDEFIVILPESTRGAGLIIAERIRRHLHQQQLATRKGPLEVTLSIGLFSFEGVQKISSVSFIEKADQALLKAKTSGKDRVVYEEDILSPGHPDEPSTNTPLGN